jgi:hypothetical protein
MVLVIVCTGILTYTGQVKGDQFIAIATSALGIIAAILGVKAGVKAKTT